MLQALRRQAGSWVAKGFLVLLAASFALWGVGDIFSGYQDPVVAEVGDRDIHASAFFNQYNQRQAELRRTFGATIDDQLFEQLGIPQQVLDEMISRLVIQVEASDLGLSAGKTDFGEWLQQQAAFRNNLGQFDRNLFAFAARSRGLDQDEFLALLGEARASELLVDSVASGARPPERWLKTFHALDQEQRSARAGVFLATESDAPEPATDEAIRAHFDTEGARYQTPQRRTLTYAVLDADALKSTVVVTDDELVDEYERRSDEYREPEQRHVRQYLAASQEDAERVVARAREGVGLTAAVEELLDDQTTDLGFVTREELEESYAEAAFSAIVDAIEGPTETGFGWRVFEVVEVREAKGATLDEVRPELTETLQLERAFDLLHDRAEVFYDERAGGASLEEAARAAGAVVSTVSEIDAQGRNSAGEAHPDAPDSALLALGFNVTADATSDLEELNDGRMIAVRVDRDIPARAMTLDEARDAILEDLAEASRLEAARERAEAYANAASSTANLSALAIANGGSLQTSEPFNRAGAGAAADFPAVAQEVAFALAAAGETSGPREFGGGYVVVTLDEIVPASEPEADVLDTDRRTLGANLGNDLVVAFLAALRDAHEVSVNRPVLDRVIADRAAPAF